MNSSTSTNTKGKKIMKKRILILAALSLLTVVYASSKNEKTFNVDTQKSSLEWVGTKVTGDHNGTIQMLSLKHT